MNCSQITDMHPGMKYISHKQNVLGTTLLRFKYYHISLYSQTILICRIKKYWLFKGAGGNSWWSIKLWLFFKMVYWKPHKLMVHVCKRKGICPKTNQCCCFIADGQSLNVHSGSLLSPAGQSCSASQKVLLQATQLCRSHARNRQQRNRF